MNVFSNVQPENYSTGHRRGGGRGNNNRGRGRGRGRGGWHNSNQSNQQKSWNNNSTYSSGERGRGRGRGRGGAQSFNQHSNYFGGHKSNNYNNNSYHHNNRGKNGQHDYSKGKRNVNVFSSEAGSVRPFGTYGTKQDFTSQGVSTINAFGTHQSHTLSHILFQTGVSNQAPTVQKQNQAFLPTTNVFAKQQSNNDVGISQQQYHYDSTPIGTPRDETMQVDTQDRNAPNNFNAFGIVTEHVQNNGSSFGHAPNLVSTTGFQPASQQLATGFQAHVNDFQKMSYTSTPVVQPGRENEDHAHDPAHDPVHISAWKADKFEVGKIPEAEPSTNLR